MSNEVRHSYERLSFCAILVIASLAGVLGIGFSPTSSWLDAATTQPVTNLTPAFRRVTLMPASGRQWAAPPLKAHPEPTRSAQGKLRQAAASEKSSGTASSPHLDVNFGNLPLGFELNQGQADQHVKFLAHGQEYSLFLTGTEAVLALPGSESGVRSPKSRLGTRRSGT